MAKKKESVKVTRKDPGKAVAARDTGASTIAREMENAFSRVLENWPAFGRRWHWPDFDPFGKFDLPAKWSKGLALPRVDMAETDDGYELTAELPGLTDKDVECTLSGNVLTVRGEKQEEKEEKKKGYYLQERSYGSFERSFTLPDDVDTDKLDASVSDGVLKVTMPKGRETRKAKKIDVRNA